MEEILASIRRIIADDDATKAAQPEPKLAAKAEIAPEPLPPPVAVPQPSVAEIRAEPPAPPAPLPSVVAPPVEAAADDEQGSDILDLTESMAAPQPAPSVVSEPASQFRKIDGHSDLSFDDPLEEPMMESAAVKVRSHYSSESAEHHEDERGRLLSPATSAAVDSAFNSLAQTVLVQNARTLEDLVREMLRPMLKSWLDDNLPGMVERLVRAEIERVSRGRMG
jgi:uncharacterized protein